MIMRLKVLLFMFGLQFPDNGSTDFEDVHRFGKLAQVLYFLFYKPLNGGSKWAYHRLHIT